MDGKEKLIPNVSKNCLNDKVLQLTLNGTQTFLITTILLEKLNRIAEMPIHLTSSVDVEKYLYLASHVRRVLFPKAAHFSNKTVNELNLLTNSLVSLH